MLPLDDADRGGRIDGGIGDDRPQGVVDARPQAAGEGRSVIALDSDGKAEVLDPSPDEGGGAPGRCGVGHGDGVKLPAGAVHRRQKVPHTFTDGQWTYNVNGDVLEPRLEYRSGIKRRINAFMRFASKALVAVGDIVVDLFSDSRPVVTC